MCGILGTSMDKTQQERFLSRDNVLFSVRYYCCEYVVYIVYVVHGAPMMCAHAVSSIYSVCTCCL